jgi:gamma-glutamyltranspeptidase / glutathione hydrolase
MNVRIKPIPKSDIGHDDGILEEKRRHPMSVKMSLDTYARRAMTATTHPHAARTGIDIMRKGGNAVDAAIAMAAMMTVVEPTSNGLGSDAFVIVRTKNGRFGLNASGPAPMSLSIGALRAKGHETMPRFGLDPVTVPGAVGGWVALHKRFGQMAFKDVLLPAIEAARDGFVVTTEIARHWKNAHGIYRKHFDRPVSKAWFETFAPTGKAPAAGEIVRLPDHANTLEQIALSDGDAFYQGTIADAIDRFSKASNGWISKDDLARYQPRWVEPVRVSYRGHDVFELPPNGQGIVALSALGMLAHRDVGQMDEETRTHTMIEALKLAFSDAQTHIADPDFHEDITVRALDPAYLEYRNRLIGDKARNHTTGILKDHGTIYLATGDPDGMMVSFIQSNYMGFGSGVVVPHTGIALNNRGMNFSMDPSHKNALEPGKRPYHTIIPAFLEKDGLPMGPFGIMGGFMQPQAHVQVLSHIIDRASGLQEALDSWRFQWMKGQEVMIESGCPEATVSALRARGHTIVVTDDGAPFGRGQIIIRDPETGVYKGATERRADGMIGTW